MSRAARAFHTTVVVSAFGYAAQGLSLVAIPLFLNTVGIDAYGLMVTVMAFTGYLTFADAGLSWGSMILVAQAHGRGSRSEIGHVVRHAMVLAGGSGAVALAATLGVVFAARQGLRFPMFSHHPEADRLILIAGAQLVLSLQFGTVYSLFQGLQEGYWTGIYQGLGRVVGLGGGMAAAWITHSIAAVMLCQLSATALSGVAATVHAWRLHPWAFAGGSWFDRAQYRAQLRVGAKNFMLQIGRTLSGTAPTFGISSLLGPAAVPLYTVPTTLLGLFFNPINSWNASMQSAYGEAWTSGAVDWTRAAFRVSLERTLLIGGLGIVLFVGVGDSFIQAWTHGRLSMGAGMTASVCAIVVTSALVSAGEFLLTGLNRQRGAALAELANGVLAITLVPLFLRWLGLGAVGLGMVAAAAATCAWVLRRDVRRLLGNHCLPSPFFLLRLAVAVGCGAACGVLMGRSVDPSDLRQVALHLALGCSGGLFVFTAAAAALRLVRYDDAAAFGRLIRQRIAPQAL